MANKLTLAFLVFMTSNFAFSDMVEQVTLKSAINKQSEILAVAEVDLSFEEGEIVNVNSDCPLIIKKKSPGAVLLNAELCQNKNVLKANYTLYLVRKEFNKKKQNITGTNEVKLKSDVKERNKNLYFGLVKSIVALNSEQSFSDNVDNAELDKEQKIGFAIGYQDVNARELGVDANFNINLYEDNLQRFKLSGSGTYGLTEKFYLHAGLNMSLIKSYNNSTNPGLGINAGLGIRLDRIGGSLSYVQTNSRFSDNNYQFKMSGLELALSALF